jgi:CRISPR-associated endonuclease/helicase Cas3
LHDWGKAHPAFALGTYLVSPLRVDLAKAPDAAWEKRKWSKTFYLTESHGPRRGFRHELASCLAVLELLRTADAKHPAILGRHEAMLVACGIDPELPTQSLDKNPIADELKSLSESEFNLLLYLIASHLGKVRVSMQASPIDQDFPFESEHFFGTGMPIRGVREGDVIPGVDLPSASGNITMPEMKISLAPAAMGLSATYGASWSERVHGLMQEFGPFTLSWLEAIIRSADGRASDDGQPPGNKPDPLLKGIELSVPDPSDTGAAEDQDDQEEALLDSSEDEVTNV